MNLAEMERFAKGNLFDTPEALETKDMVRRLIAVARAAQELLGPTNLGKTIDLNRQWDGAVSVISSGDALWGLCVALKALGE